MSPEEQNTQQKTLPDLFRNKNFIKALLGALVVLGVIIFVLLLKNSELLSPPKAVLGDKTFTIALADDPKERMNGLSGKDRLQEDRGMLFVFEKPDYYSFWMRGMKFPLDIIFIKDDKIVKIFQNVSTSREESLPVYQPSIPSDKVLEINAGLSKEYGFKEGQTIKFENL